MLNYLKSEVYQIVHKKAAYLFIIICTGLLIAMNVVLHQVGAGDAKFSYDTTAFSFSTIYSNLYFILILCITVSTIIFGEEFQNHTLKNSISFGISRRTIILSKMILEILYAIIAFIIIIGCFIGSAYLLLENSGSIQLEYLLKGCIAGIPLFIFVLALCNTLYALVEKTGLCVGIATIIILVFPLVVNEFANRYDIARKIAEYLPLNMISAYRFTETGFTADWLNPNVILKYYGVGLIYSAIALIIGLIIFRNKEIK